MSPRLEPPRSLLVALWTVLATGCGDTGGDGPLVELARLHDARTIGPRISIERTYAECPRGAPPADGSALAAKLCEEPPPDSDEDLLELASRVAAAIAADPEPEFLQAAGLIDLVWGGGTANSLDRAISHLTAAARLSDEPAGALADLAAAHLVRFEISGSPRDLLRALDAADRAARLAPDDPVAAYNLAYAADRLTLDDLATEAWGLYAAAFPREGWAREGRARADALAHVGTAPPSPSPGASAVEARAFAREAPRQARILGWDHLLGDWGAAVLAGDSARANETLRLAAVLGAEIARSGDASLGDAVRTIQRVSDDPAALRALASAHGAFAAGRAALARNDAGRAERAFSEGLSRSPDSPALVGWLIAYRALSEAFGGDRDRALEELRQLAARVDEVRHPALAGQVHAVITTIMLRAGRYEDALHSVSVAADHYRRTGEREALGSQLYLQADVEMALGSFERSYTSLIRSLETLRPDRTSVWRYNALVVMGESVAGEGLHDAALRLLTEGVSAMERAERPDNLVEGLLLRARVKAERGDRAGATADLLRAQDRLADVHSELSRTWLATDLRLAAAALALDADPIRATEALDSILSDPASVGTTLRLVQALIARADARLALGDRDGSLSDLDRASEIIAAESAATGSAPLRISLLEKARSVFEKLALAEVAAGDAGAALRHVERGRLSFAAASTGATWATASQQGTSELVLSYLLAGDTVLAWVVGPDGISLTRTVVPRQELTRTIERAVTSLELGAGEQTLQADLAALHRWLIGPLEQRLRPGTESIAIVADGEISAVPFPALTNGEGRHLVERYGIRFAPSVREAIGGRQRDAAGQASAVFVAAGDAVGREFAPLPGSTREVRTLAGFYPRATVLLGHAADKRALLGVLGQTGLFHFAGHAVLDAARPELSYLVVPNGTGSGHGRLTAAELEGMDLRNVRLVVLSACETLGSHGSRAGGFGGFAGILLSAGAGGVIGSTWMVDDAATARLMIAFHTAYARTGDGPGALRAAQLQLLRSDSPEDRSPAAWAAFRYAGR